MYTRIADNRLVYIKQEPSRVSPRRFLSLFGWDYPFQLTVCRRWAIRSMSGYPSMAIRHRTVNKIVPEKLSMLISWLWLDLMQTFWTKPLGTPVITVPTNGVPTDRVPADRVPADGIPTDRIPADTTPGNGIRPCCK
jgi:hypothetical protein